MPETGGTRRITVRVPDTFYEAVTQEAVRMGETRGQFVREALMAHVLFCRLAHGESLYAAAFATAKAMNGVDDPGALRELVLRATRQLRFDDEGGTQ